MTKGNVNCKKIALIALIVVLVCGFVAELIVTQGFKIRTPLDVSVASGHALCLGPPAVAVQNNGDMLRYRHSLLLFHHKQKTCRRHVFRITDLNCHNLFRLLLDNPVDILYKLVGDLLNITLKFLDLVL